MKGTLIKFEKEVLEARGSGESLQMIGLRYGVSREAVRQFVVRRGGDLAANMARPYSLSVVDRDGRLRYFGTHVSEGAAADHFFTRVPVSQNILAFAVYAKGQCNERRLWQGVIMEETAFRRVGAPAHGMESCLHNRAAALDKPLPLDSEELANLLGPTEVLRNSLERFHVTKQGPGIFMLNAKTVMVDKPVEDELAKLLG